MKFNNKAFIEEQQYLLDKGFKIGIIRRIKHNIKRIWWKILRYSF